MSSRDEYISRINRAIDFIERGLDSALPLREVARVACFSPFHFHRLFTAMVGESMSQFIARLRTEKAAHQLLHNRSKSITDIALDCGFSSSAAFARAFRRSFGMSASDWRAGGGPSGGADSKMGKTDGNLGKASSAVEVYFDDEHKEMRWRVTMSSSSEISAQVEIREIDPMHMAYIRHVGPYQGDEALFERLWGEVMAWAGPRGLFRPPNTKCITVYHDNPDVTDAEKYRMSLGITVSKDTPVDGPVGKMSVAGGRYAVAAFEIDPTQYGDAWKVIFAGWLPDSGYQPDDRPAFELALNNPKEHPEGKHQFEIWLPVKAQ